MKLPIHVLCTMIALFFGCSPSSELTTNAKLEQTKSIPAVKGEDLRYDMFIRKNEELFGFEQTIEFERPRYYYQNDTLLETSEYISMLISMPLGWALNIERKQNKDYHYALIKRGAGGIGLPPENNGDLYIAITVMEASNQKVQEPGTVPRDD